MAVKGFDFVPESLRSSTYSQAARKVLVAHFGFNNFYNEPKPVRDLVNLGSTIPKPAFPICMSALLCVRLGNQFGVSDAAQEPVDSILNNLRRSQWKYYLVECLRTDKNVLEKIYQKNSPLYNWKKLIKEFNLSEFEFENSRIKKVINGKNDKDISKAAKSLRMRIQSED